MTFLPCCYGYATTIWRAQGASLDMGCLYFELKKHYAGRGYAYVGCSRFKSRAGCHLYGKLRQSDFLPVGEDKEDEVWERGIDSMDENESEYEDLEQACDSESEYDEVYERRSLSSVDTSQAARYNPAFDADFAF